MNELNVTQAEIEIKNGNCEISKSSVETIVLDAANGSVSVKESQVEHTTLKALTGDVFVEDSCGTELFVSNALGDIKICAEFAQYSCKNQSGDVFLQIRNDADVSARNTSGDVTVELFGIQRQYQCSIGSVYGECNVIGWEEQQNKELHGDEEALHTFSANSVFGDVTVKFL